MEKYQLMEGLRERLALRCKPRLGKGVAARAFALSLALAVALGTATALTACSGSPAANIDSATVAEGSSSKTSDTSKATSKASYPVTVTTYGSDQKPVELTFDKAPEKVVAVYQNDIENLLALGLGDRIVMATGLDHDVLPSLKDGFDTINYTNDYTPSKETVLSYDPDFILGWSSLFADDTLGSIESWQEQGVNAYSSMNSGGVKERTLENEYTDLENLGKIFGVEDKAAELIDEIKAAVSDTVDHAKSEGTTPKVLVMETLNGNITNYGASTLCGDMVTQLGGELVYPDAKKIGTEDIIKADPDIIFAVYMDSSGENMAQTVKDNILNDPALADLKAVKEGRVVPIELGQMYCSGVRTIDGIHTLANGMYPGLDLK